MSEPSGKPIAAAASTPLERLLFWLSIGLGLGAVQKAPGTFGSLWGPLLVWGLKSISAEAVFMSVAGILIFLVGIPICAAGIRHYQLGDPKHVVFDEIAAFPFVFLFVPLTWGTAIAGFILFRIFDIAKPWPVSRFERLPGALGVMSDDLVAGLIAGLILTGLYASLGPF